ncbi:MAG: hypothetical protein PPFGHCPK_00851 [Spiroplasma endosymbiont of Drosophila atripex]|nr:MAG: hypothetical protein PPFGHCPK_00851 [Spiroplasma endosymbiont of Drosophila atripex]
MKKIQIITILLFILTILFIISGLILIDFCDYHSHIRNQTTLKFENIERNGFQILTITSIYHILEYSPKYVCYISQNIGNYYNWIELKIGVIFCIILTPIFGFFTIALTFLIIGLKVKIKNNNFWDAIENCEIINNYYIH